MEIRETSQAIDEAAAEWAARVEGAQLTADEKERLEAWLAGSSRRLGAFAKARAVVKQIQRSKGQGAARLTSSRHVRPSPSRRSFLQLGSAAAAVAGLAITTKYALDAQGQRFATRQGEVRIVPLAGGSSVTLNTASKIAVFIKGAELLVRLIEGEALFSIASDAGRAFVIEAGDKLIRSSGSQLMVSHLTAGSVSVLVRDGTALIADRRVSGQPVRLKANTRAQLPKGERPVVETVTPEAVGRDIIWREGMLLFEDMPLEQAVKQIARYNSQPILIDNPDIAAETVTGLFSATDPEGFAQAIAESHGLRVRKDADGLHISQ